MATKQYGPLPNLPATGAARADYNDIFDSMVINQLNDDNLLRNLFRRLPQTGNPYGFRVRTGRNPTAGTRAENTDASPLANADYGNQSRLRVAEEAAIFYVGVSVTDYASRSAAGAGGIELLLEETTGAMMDLREVEEENLFAIRAPNGDISGEVATSLVGIPHVLQDASPTPTNTDTLYGQDRTSATVLFGVADYNAGTPRAVTTQLIDTNLRITHENGGKVNLFLTKREQHDNINNLLQSQQRFMNETQIAAGFVVTTYRGIPIVTSVNCSDRHGATLVNDPAGPGDLFGLDMRWWEMRVLKELQRTDIAKDGQNTKYYMEAFQQLICKKPNSSFAIYDLS